MKASNVFFASFNTGANIFIYKKKKCFQMIKLKYKFWNSFKYHSGWLAEMFIIVLFQAILTWIGT